MKTQDSIHAIGKSFDVYEGYSDDVIEEVKSELQDTYNTILEPKITPIDNVMIENFEYKLFQACIESAASTDYFYFAVIK